MTDSIYLEGWLIRSRDRGMHFPPFKSKWVRRYFVLRICDKRLGTYVLDEFRKEDKRRLRKSLDLVRCIQSRAEVSFCDPFVYNMQAATSAQSGTQIDSHLQLADSSCATTSRLGGFQWIFSLYFSKGASTSSQKKTPLYFVAESEEKMKDWVYSLCRACRLEKETDEDNNSVIHPHACHIEAPCHRSTLPSSLGGLSVYSDRSSESMLDTPRSEVSREYEVKAARSRRDEDELHTLEFARNPKRVSRFSSRLFASASYDIGSHSNPLRPSDFLSSVSTMRGISKNATSSSVESKDIPSFWRVGLRQYGHLRCAFPKSFFEIFVPRPLEILLEKEMDGPSSSKTPPPDTSPDDETQFKSRRPNFHSRNFRNHSTLRHAPSTSVSRRSTQQRGTRRRDSLEPPRASSSASACSSITSDHPSDEVDDDSTSCISQLSNLSCGPPIPPRTRLGPQHSSASSSSGVPVKRFALEHISPISSNPARVVSGGTMDNDSSGETIKLHGIRPYANSHCTSEGALRSATAFLPPAVDRSNKPAKLRLYECEEVPEEMAIRGYNKSGSNLNRTPRTPQAKALPKSRDVREPPKSAGPLGRSRELDYFNPVPLDRAHSMRSPAPSDIEYIKIDAEKTQAVKQSIAQRATIE